MKLVAQRLVRFAHPLAHQRHLLGASVLMPAGARVLDVLQRRHELAHADVAVLCRLVALEVMVQL